MFHLSLIAGKLHYTPIKLYLLQRISDLVSSPPLRFFFFFSLVNTVDDDDDDDHHHCNIVSID